MLVDPTEQLHMVGLRVRVKLQQARWPLQIVQLMTGLSIVQDDVVLVVPVNQDNIRPAFGTQVEALNEVVRFGVFSRLNLQLCEHLSERGRR